VRVKGFDEVAGRLFGVLRDGTVTPQVVTTLTASIIAGMASQPDDLKQHRVRLANQYRSELAELGNSVGMEATAAFVDGVFVLEAAAGLQKKEEMCIYTAVTSSGELAGAGLYAFQGFLDERYRQHDYDVGRIKARALLGQINEDGKGLAPLRLGQWTAPEQDAALNGLQLGAIARDQRVRLRAQLVNRAQVTMRELHFNWFEQLGARILVGRSLKRLLAL
jgi:hypothetical protein